MRFILAASAALLVSASSVSQQMAEDLAQLDNVPNFDYVQLEEGGPLDPNAPFKKLIGLTTKERYHLKKLIAHLATLKTKHLKAKNKHHHLKTTEALAAKVKKARDEMNKLSTQIK